ncbi:MAG: fructuronate reductase [Patiriisocius sp.]|jgi:fructuronate reductase
MSRLCLENLPLLPSVVLAPGYLGNHLPGVGIVHLGIGQFAKAHLACYTDTVLDQVGGDWRIVGASLRSNTSVKQLKPQDNLYTVTSESGESLNKSSDPKSEFRVIGALAEVLAVQFGDRLKLLEYLLSPSTRIVSLTVTEKGYYQNAAGNLDIEQADIQADLANPGEPLTAIGWLVLAIKLRREQGTPPFTPLALDNLISNGAVLKRMVLEFSMHSDTGLGQYIEEHISFPSTMVDRIVPAVDAASLEATKARLGMIDQACVHTELFSQWVVEDRFLSGRPQWELAGVILCDDVTPFEIMKLRLLNGAHSCLAYLGVLLQYNTVADCMNDASVRAYIEIMMRTEIQPLVSPPAGFDLDRYITQLLMRFSNPGLRHRCEQIAMDGSQKIPQRLLPVLEERLEHGLSVTYLIFAVSVWMVFVQRQDSLVDPRSSELKSLVQGADPAELVARLIGTNIFSQRLQSSTLLLAGLTSTVTSISRLGVNTALDECLTED